MADVATIMRRNPKIVSPNMTLNFLEERFIESHFTGFPVVEKGRLVGVVSRSDVVRSLLTERSRAEQMSDFCSQMGPASEDETARSLESIASQVGVRLATLCVTDVMATNVVTIESDRSLQELAQLMVEGEIHRVPVIARGELIGLVSSMDLVRAVADGLLEEGGSPVASERLLAEA
ncbi:MAG: hypothetical protein CL908_10315 [Deltaproteobacteria bacterium]|nr:hypothetical protein [Deltaproteobacteria bacterium]